VREQKYADIFPPDYRSRKMHRTLTERPGYRREPSDLHSGPPWRVLDRRRRSL
jgi:hypothetical protein